MNSSVEVISPARALHSGRQISHLSANANTVDKLKSLSTRHPNSQLVCSLRGYQVIIDNRLEDGVIREHYNYPSISLGIN